MLEIHTFTAVYNTLYIHCDQGGMHKMTLTSAIVTNYNGSTRS